MTCNVFPSTELRVVSASWVLMSERQIGVRRAFVGVSIHSRQPDPPPLVTRGRRKALFIIHLPADMRGDRRVSVQQVRHLGVQTAGRVHANPPSYLSWWLSAWGVGGGAATLGGRFVGFVGYSCDDEVSADNRICHPSVYQYRFLPAFGVTGSAGASPCDSLADTLDRLPVPIDKQPLHPNVHICRDNFHFPNHLKCMLLDCGRKGAEQGEHAHSVSPGVKPATFLLLNGVVNQASP